MTDDTAGKFREAIASSKACGFSLIRFTSCTTHHYSITKPDPAQSITFCCEKIHRVSNLTKIIPKQKFAFGGRKDGQGLILSFATVGKRIREGGGHASSSMRRAFVGRISFSAESLSDQNLISPFRRLKRYKTPPSILFR
jgi:hypothetical protein